MSNVKQYGQLESWDDDNGGSGFSRDDFLYLNTDGQYRVRVITNPPFRFYLHWAEGAGGKRVRVNCAMTDCVLCKEGNVSKKQYMSTVIDRRDGNPKVLEFGPSIYKDLKILNSQEVWGELNTYDVIIDRLKSRGPKTYSVLGVPDKSPVTAEEQDALNTFAERMDLLRLCEPAENSVILEKLGRAGPAPAAAATTGQDWNNTATASATPGELTDSDFNF